MADEGGHNEAATGRAKGGPVTVSQAFGEIVWLIGQSPLHRNLRVADLDWLVMPAVLHKQFHLFREGTRPVGVALWAKVDAEGERKLVEGLLQGGNQLSEPEWAAGDRLWLVDLIAPFATTRNRHREVMFADLLTGKLKGQAFRTMRIDSVTGQRNIVDIAADAGEVLATQVAKAVTK